MAAKRFKAVPEEGAPRRADARPVAHARADAQAHSEVNARGVASHDDGVAPASGRPERGGRFARASRATAALHSFPHLGGRADLGVREGQVPVTTPGGDVEGAVFSTDDAPRPVSAASARSGSFDTISAGEGAVAPSRESAPMPAATGARPGRAHGRSDKDRVASAARFPGGERGVMLAVLAGALIVIALLVTTCSGPFGSGDNAQGGADKPAATTQGAQGSSLPTEGVFDVGGALTFAQGTFGVVQADDSWTLSHLAGDEDQVLYTFAGTPVAVALHAGVLYVPENLGDGTWDVISYVMADGGVAGQMVSSNGDAVTGRGTIASVEVGDDGLALIDSAGTRTVIPLS